MSSESRKEIYHPAVDKHEGVLTFWPNVRVASRFGGSMTAVPSETTRPLQTLPGPRGMPLFGSIFDVWRDPLGFLLRGARDHGDVVRFRFGPYDYLLLNDPEVVRHVLVENARAYRKSKSYDALRLVLGNGLVTSEGDFWRRQRKLAQPAFHKKRM